MRECVGISRPCGSQRAGAVGRRAGLDWRARVGGHTVQDSVGCWSDEGLDAGWMLANRRQTGEEARTGGIVEASNTRRMRLADLGLLRDNVLSRSVDAILRSPPDYSFPAESPVTLLGCAPISRPRCPRRRPRRNPNATPANRHPDHPRFVALRHAALAWESASSRLRSRAVWEKHLAPDREATLEGATLGPHTESASGD